MLNHVQIIGRLGGDPELKNLESGQSVANFNVATNEKWTGKDGQKHEKVEWFRVVVWGPLAQTAKDHLSKGRQVYVSGKMQTRSWEDSGGKKYVTELVANTIKFLGDNPNSENSFSPSDYNPDDHIPF